MTTNEKQFVFTACLGLMLVYAANKGFTISLRGVGRARAYQKWLYEIGRTRELDREPVTWTPDKSFHIDALAGDIIVFVDGKPIWDADHPIYQELGKMWEELGGVWGGRWKGKKRDAPHFQWAVKMMEGGT